MTTALVIHGHFYQPPRENPWTELIDREHGAGPFHDWNERVAAECYHDERMKDEVWATKDGLHFFLHPSSFILQI